MVDLGQTDIYAVDILENNKYSEPRNLGPKINTEGREMFPFVSKDSTFYFSSDGRLNLGLLDIFESNFIKDKIALPKNLGAPYNSGYDDFAYFIDPSKVKEKEVFYLQIDQAEMEVMIFIQCIPKHVLKPSKELQEIKNIMSLKRCACKTY